MDITRKYNASNSLLLPSYLNVREIIKIEEMNPISDDGRCLNDTTKDLKDVYSFCRVMDLGHEISFWWKLCTSCTRIRPKSHLMAHKNPHTTEMPYKCDECDKPFSQKANFRQRQVIHTWKEAFKYVEYSKQFTHSGRLKQHKLHILEKSFWMWWMC